VGLIERLRAAFAALGRGQPDDQAGKRIDAARERLKQTIPPPEDKERGP
jgi:hypothetical protein